jgi:hypothetical protein
MRRALLLIGAILLAANTGCGIGDQMFGFHKPWGGGDCGCNNGCGCGAGGCNACGEGGCNACGNGGCGANDPNGYANGGDPNGGGMAGHGPLPRGAGGTYVGPQGPPTGGVAYPYYATRGPRDFLVNNPPSIGN